MQKLDSTYVGIDARVKIVVLFAFTVCVFFVETWAGAIALCAATLIAMLASRVPLGRYFGALGPVYVIMTLTIVFNMFVGTDVLASLAPLPLAITASGLSRGILYALRILLLCLASMIVSLTTTSTELTDAFGRMLRPLRRIHVPVDDITTVLSLSLRFIPLLTLETQRVRNAHQSRGACFDKGLVPRLKAWGDVLIAVFIRLFKRADRLACAMDARCYGLPEVQRTAMSAAKMTLASSAFLVAALAFLIGLAILL